MKQSHILPVQRWTYSFISLSENISIFRPQNTIPIKNILWKNKVYTIPGIPRGCPILYESYDMITNSKALLQTNFINKICFKDRHKIFRFGLVKQNDFVKISEHFLKFLKFSASKIFTQRYKG